MGWGWKRLSAFDPGKLKMPPFRPPSWVERFLTVLSILWRPVLTILVIILVIIMFVWAVLVSRSEWKRDNQQCNIRCKAHGYAAGETEPWLHHVACRCFVLEGHGPSFLLREKGF